MSRNSAVSLKTAAPNHLFPLTLLTCCLLTFFPLPFAMAKESDYSRPTLATNPKITQQFISGLAKQQGDGDAALGYARLFWMVCPFNTDSISIATNLLPAAWMTKELSAGKGNAFVAAQKDAAVQNLLTEVKLPESDSSVRATAITNLPQPARKNGDNGIKSNTDEQWVWFQNSPTARKNSETVWPMNTVANILQLSATRDARKLSQSFKRFNIKFIKKETLGGIETYMLSDEAVAGQKSVNKFWIAPSKDYLVLRQESGPKNINVDEEILSWRDVTVVDKITKVNNIWLAASQHHIHYLTLKSDPKHEVWEFAGRDTLISANINQPVPIESFHLPIPPGVRVAQEIGPSDVIKGNLDAFQGKLKKQKLQGDQPDLKSVIASLTLPSTNPDSLILKDMPVNGSIQKVNVPATVMLKNIENK